MKRLILHGQPLLLVLLSFSVAGQSTKEISSFGWKVYSHSFDDAFGCFRNEAGLAHFDDFTAGILAERRFMLEATSVYAFSVVLPFASGALSVQGVRSGYTNFSQQRLAVAYGMPLTSWLSTGMQLDYLNMRIPSYGGAHAFTFGVSALMHWRDQWTIGLQTINPHGAKYNGLGGDAIPALYRFGVGYQPSEVFFLSTEISALGGASREVAAAFHYKIIKHLGINGGVSTGAESVFLGISIFMEHVDMIFSGEIHPQLGVSPAAGFIYKQEGEKR